LLSSVFAQTTVFVGWWKTACMRGSTPSMCTQRCGTMACEEYPLFDYTNPYVQNVLSCAGANDATYADFDFDVSLQLLRQHIPFAAFYSITWRVWSFAIQQHWSITVNYLQTKIQTNTFCIHAHFCSLLSNTISGAPNIESKDLKRQTDSEFSTPVVTVSSKPSPPKRAIGSRLQFLKIKSHQHGFRQLQMEEREIIKWVCWGGSGTETHIHHLYSKFIFNSSSYISVQLLDGTRISCRFPTPYSFCVNFIDNNTCYNLSSRLDISDWSLHDLFSVQLIMQSNSSKPLCQGAIYGSQAVPTPSATPSTAPGFGPTSMSQTVSLATMMCAPAIVLILSSLLGAVY
jgi:hypothetical protein